MARVVMMVTSLIMYRTTILKGCSPNLDTSRFSCEYWWGRTFGSCRRAFCDVWALESGGWLVERETRLENGTWERLLLVEKEIDKLGQLISSPEDCVQELLVSKHSSGANLVGMGVETDLLKTFLTARDRAIKVLWMTLGGKADDF